MEQEVDPIIKEYPMYMPDAYLDQLYLFKYVTRKHGMVIKDNVTHATIKPENQIVKLDVALDVKASSFDSERATEFAEMALANHSNKEGDEGPYKNNMVDSQLFSSIKVAENSFNLGAAYLYENAIHISPLVGLLHMYPDFPYLNSNEKADSDSEKSLESEESETEQVNVSFARMDIEKMRKKQEKVYSNYLKKIADEPWCNTSYHHSNSTLAEDERVKLLGNTESDKPFTCQKSMNFLHNMLPIDANDYSRSTSFTPLKSIPYLRTLPANEQITLIIKTVKVARCNKIVKVLCQGTSITRDMVLKSLPLVAYLVRGNWVVRSDLIYPKGTRSKYYGFSSEMMCRYRDYMLYMFTQHQFLERNQIECLIKLPRLEFKDLYQDFARYKPTQGYEFKFPTDKKFIDAFPDIVEQQESMWVTRKSKFDTFMIEKEKKRERKRSRSDSGGTKRLNKTSPSTKKQKVSDKKIKKPDNKKGG